MKHFYRYQFINMPNALKGKNMSNIPAHLDEHVGIDLCKVDFFPPCAQDVPFN